MDGELAAEWSSYKHERQGVSMDENDQEMERKRREVRPTFQRL